MPSILHYDVNGVPVRFVRLAADLALYPNPPAGGGSLSIDEEDNAAAGATLAREMAQTHSVVAGVLKRNGVTVTINPASTGTVQRQAALSGAVGVKADRSTTLGTLSDVPDLAFALDPNTLYSFSFRGAYTAAAGTTGLQLALNGPASPAIFGATVKICEGANAADRNGAVGGYNAVVAGLNSGGATPLPFAVDGVVKTGAAGGTLALRFQSEVAGSAVTIKQGSYGLLIKAG